jgi:hypothetical protein
MYPNQGISKCYLCLLVHIECNKITLITLPSLRQEFSDITCEIFDLAFTLCDFPGLYQLMTQEITKSEIGFLLHSKHY